MKVFVYRTINAISIVHFFFIFLIISSVKKKPHPEFQILFKNSVLKKTGKSGITHNWDFIFQIHLINSYLKF